MDDLKLLPDDLSIPECLKVENRPEILVNPPTLKEEKGAMRTSAAKKVGPREAELRNRRRNSDKLRELNKPVEAKNGNGKHPVEATISTLPVVPMPKKVKARDAEVERRISQPRKAKATIEARPTPYEGAGAKAAKDLVAAKPKGKMQMVEDMLLRKNGATREEMSKASGWPHVNLDMQLKRYRKRVSSAKLVEEKGHFRLTS